MQPLENEKDATSPGARYQSLLESVDGIVWEADARSFAFTFISDSVFHILGYTTEEWMTDPEFWKNHIYAHDRDQAVNYCHYETQKMRSHTFDYRMVKADGSIAWIRDIVSVVPENGQPRWLRGIMVDITQNKLRTDLDKLEKDVLELNSLKNAEIEAVLLFYVQGIEQLFPGMICTVMRVSDNRIYNWASPSVPAEYIAGIHGMEAGPESGSCGTSVYLKEQVIVTDIEHDPKWSKYKHLALPHNLLACWSYPIIDSQGKVIAVFGIYYETIKKPNHDEQAIIERSAAILKVIIENRLYAQMMQEMNMLVTQGQSLANFGTWQWDIARDIVDWSGVLYDIYGLDAEAFKATFNGYQAMLHPDDRERVQQIIMSALANQQDVVFEERIIRPDGDIRHLKSWGRVIADETGKPTKMIGACLDITKAKATETKMQEIAWLQSHVIRAPLARLMGVVALLQHHSLPDADLNELLGSIQDSAEELDQLIREISANTAV